MNLDLTTIRFPITAISSILHRITGVILFLFIPLLLWALGTMLISTEGFAKVESCFANPIVKFINWGLLSCLLYHVVAGIRHLLMDMGIGESKTGGKRGAQLVLVISAILITGER